MRFGHIAAALSTLLLHAIYAVPFDPTIKPDLTSPTNNVSSSLLDANAQRQYKLTKRFGPTLLPEKSCWMATIFALHSYVDEDLSLEVEDKDFNFPYYEDVTIYLRKVNPYSYTMKRRYAFWLLLKSIQIMATEKKFQYLTTYLEDRNGALLQVMFVPGPGGSSSTPLIGAGNMTLSPHSLARRDETLAQPSNASDATAPLTDRAHEVRFIPTSSGAPLPPSAFFSSIMHALFQLALFPSSSDEIDPFAVSGDPFTSYVSIAHYEKPTFQPPMFLVWHAADALKAIAFSAAEYERGEGKGGEWKGKGCREMETVVEVSWFGGPFRLRGRIGISKAKPKEPGLEGVGGVDIS